MKEEVERKKLGESTATIDELMNEHEAEAHLYNYVLSQHEEEPNVPHRQVSGIADTI